MKLRHALFSIDAKYKKKKKYQEPESDLDDEAIESHEEQLKAKDLEKAEKKFQKDNEKLVEDGKKPQDDSVLKEKLKEVEAEYKRLKKERGTEKHALKKERPTEKIEDAIDKLDEKIKAFKLQMEDREAGKEVALSTRCVVGAHLRVVIVLTDACLVKSTTWILGTSPCALGDFAILTSSCRRITVAWCKDNDVPVEKLFSKTLITKCASSARSAACALVLICLQSPGLWRRTQSGSSEGAAATLLPYYSQHPRNADRIPSVHIIITDGPVHIVPFALLTLSPSHTRRIHTELSL